MAEVIKDFEYKTPGRGRGVLGMRDFDPCRRPGGARERARQTKSSQSVAETERKRDYSKLVVAMYSYVANLESPGGFSELSITKGQFLEFVGEHPSNEHWWELRNEDGEEGFVPSSYVLIKEEQGLPWLQLSALQNEEQERKERARRLVQQKDSKSGLGFGLPPKNLLPKPYVSAYTRGQQTQPKSNPSEFYCDVCDKQLNGPKPYQAHMASKSHREELALLNT